MRRRLSALPALLGILLLARAAAAEPARQPPEPPPSACAALEPGTHDVQVRWGTPATRSSCFYFSGPGELGRDDPLGNRARLTWQGNRMTLAFGSARFEGEVRGDAVTLTRTSTHEFGGPWTVRERIEGRLAEVDRGGARCRGLRARYAYEEQPAGGPVGQCTIAASLSVAR